MSSAEWATERWYWESTAGTDQETVHEILTATTQTHVCYVTRADVAAHMVELHNRTHGDGQDAPGKVNAADLARDWGQGRPPASGRERTIPAAWLPGRVLDQPAYRRGGPVNPPRGHLPQDLQLARMYGPAVQVDIRNGVERLLAELVNRRVTDYVANHQPPVLHVPAESLPSEALIHVLEQRGYVVRMEGASE